MLTNGSKYEGTIRSVEYTIGDRTIKYGCEGQDVKLMQEMLLKLDYDLGSWGCDGDFGDRTDLALRAFQTDARLDMDGECGPATLVALEKAVDALDGAGCGGDSCPINVTIVGGNCYIRTAPNTDGKILGVAHKGDKLPYGGKVSEGGLSVGAVQELECLGIREVWKTGVTSERHMKTHRKSTGWY